ncbi:hypothetical protein L5515_006596 [Caenorhabditis briggsae]|uniref:Uncharacterized protein n=1 Tax=Caenorhabditis briggsae TaxID=6238 RepID=A0AAE9JJP5_CAEBR|nr:hypothetical protein L5515_006596 [Caenorhabditis briggsae]
MVDIEMTLYHVLTNNLEMSKLYKCPPNMTTNLIPRPIIGSYFMISGIALIIIYLPCFVLHMGIDEQIAAERDGEVASVSNVMNLMSGTAKVAPFLCESSL